MHLSFHMGNHYNCLTPIAVAAEVVNVPQKEKHQNVGEVVGEVVAVEVAEQASSTFKVNVNINEEMKEKKKEDDIDIQEREEEEKSGPTVLRKSQQQHEHEQEKEILDTRLDSKYICNRVAQSTQEGTE